MVAETISLGILSLPAAVAGVGLVPAIIILIGLGLLASYTGYVIGQFKWRYPHISSMADAGEVLMGRFGRELFGTAQLLFLVFLMASHILTFTVAFNVITKHGTCTLVFGVVGMVLSIFLSIPRTLAKVSWLSLICKFYQLLMLHERLCHKYRQLTMILTAFISILAAVLLTMIALGIEKPNTVIYPTVETNLVTAFMSAANIGFSYGLWIS